MQRWGSRPTTLELSPELLLKLDLNRADHVQFLQLPGVGDNLARRIEAYRLERHGFESVEELRHVSGIGPTMLERLRPFVYVERVQDDEDDETAGRTAFYHGPTAPARMPAPTTTGEKKAASKKGDGLKELVNINEASLSELQHLPGVGPKLAARIVEAREKKPFRKVDDLRQVPGIGPKTLENLRPRVTADTSSPIEKQQ
jgi:competence ComEA-like helix-hairpin-helix protein